MTAPKPETQTDGQTVAHSEIQGQATPGEPQAPSTPLWRRSLAALVRNPVALAGLVVLAVLLVCAVFGSAIAPAGPNDTDVPRAFTPPSLEYPMGTDNLGRDVFSRVILSASTAVQVSLVSVGIALVAGCLLGLLAGFYGGWVDTVIMRIVDVMFAFPVMLLAIAIVAVLGTGVNAAIIAIGVVYTPIFARVTRASTLAAREEPYVRAARSLGAGDARIMTRHVLPNISAPIIVQTSLSFAFAILSEAALSFLGLGVQPPDPSWGRMLFEAKEFLAQGWWMSVFPGLAILLTVLAFNLVGDALRDVLDPKTVTREVR